MLSNWVQWILFASVIKIGSWFILERSNIFAARILLEWRRVRNIYSLRCIIPFSERVKDVREDRQFTKRREMEISYLGKSIVGNKKGPFRSDCGEAQRMGMSIS